MNLFSRKHKRKRPKTCTKEKYFLFLQADLKHKKMGIYKYQAEIDALIQQGLKMPEVVKPNDLKGFRFVFSTDMSKSYIPNYIMKPQRAIMNDQRKVDVGGYALDDNITTPASNGHYNLFEFPSCDLSKTFKLEEGKL